jgi:hypothetical protein
MLTLAVARLAYTNISVAGSSREINARIDRFLERDAARADATEARTNRLLEMLAADARRSSTPNIIVVPSPLSGN